MLSLIKNENMKIFRRIRTWIMMAIMLGAVILVAAITNGVANHEEDWETKVENEIRNYEDIIQEEQKIAEAEPRNSIDSTRVINDLEGEIDRLQRYLDEGVNPYENNVWTFVNESTFLISLISLFVVIVAADMVASEFSWGTIKMLMIRPFTRGQILLSKFMAIIIYQTVLLALLFILSWIIGGFVFGFAGFDYKTIEFTTNGDAESTIESLAALKIYGLRFLSLMVVASLAFMISAAFRSNTIAIGVGVFVLLSGNIFTMLLSQYDWGKFILFPNLNLAQYVDGTQMLMEGLSLSFSLIVDAVYFVIFMVLAWWIFKKRDIAA
ncbi:ABC transporter permease [Salinibacillus xinjiangensis]|uniref:ABC transporter permease subunit n=1 Tax=Salinibacillus xinjiangensis TaxID=1229268 RepID=A0A6G1X770_9BACI|nr:ABC transporter permease [Salinibacillus xinjiangensis]MRG86814.1 ABC transporter permease subunit [Salinibacillus xinjiangensis]